jgi:hypothetical protein
MHLAGRDVVKIHNGIFTHSNHEDGAGLERLGYIGICRLNRGKGVLLKLLFDDRIEVSAVSVYLANKGILTLPSVSVSLNNLDPSSS